MAPASGLAKGAYVLVETAGESPDVILIATGSEVALALDVYARLTKDGIASRVVSMPCWELFEAQPQAYRDAVLPPDVRARVSIEAATPFGWERYVGRDGAIVGVERFGASAPGPVVMREFGFTPEHVISTVKTVSRAHGRAAQARPDLAAKPARRGRLETAGSPLPGRRRQRPRSSIDRATAGAMRSTRPSGRPRSPRSLRVRRSRRCCCCPR